MYMYTHVHTHTHTHTQLNLWHVWELWWRLLYSETTATFLYIPDILDSMYMYIHVYTEPLHRVHDCILPLCT